MKKLIVTLAASAAVLVSGLALAASSKEVSPHKMGERSVFSDRAIAERIAPVGSLCVDGEECGTGSASAAAKSGPRAGDVIYNQFCAGCHATGAAGAPIVGDAGAWSARLGQGKATLVKHAIEGIRAMPPRGMCMDCSDDEIKASVEYMLAESK